MSETEDGNTSNVMNNDITVDNEDGQTENNLDANQSDSSVQEMFIDETDYQEEEGCAEIVLASIELETSLDTRIIPATPACVQQTYENISKILSTDTVPADLSDVQICVWKEKVNKHGERETWKNPNLLSEMTTILDAFAVLNVDQESHSNQPEGETDTENIEAQDDVVDAAADGRAQTLSDESIFKRLRAKFSPTYLRYMSQKALEHFIRKAERNELGDNKPGISAHDKTKVLHLISKCETAKGLRNATKVIAGDIQNFITYQRIPNKCAAVITDRSINEHYSALLDSSGIIDSGLVLDMKKGEDSFYNTLAFLATGDESFCDEFFITACYLFSIQSDNIKKRSIRRYYELRKLVISKKVSNSLVSILATGLQRNIFLFRPKFDGKGDELRKFSFQQSQDFENPKNDIFILFTGESDCYLPIIPKPGCVRVNLIADPINIPSMVENAQLVEKQNVMQKYEYLDMVANVYYHAERHERDNILRRCNHIIRGQFQLIFEGQHMTQYYRPGVHTIVSKELCNIYKLIPYAVPVCIQESCHSSLYQEILNSQEYTIARCLSVALSSGNEFSTTIYLALEYFNAISEVDLNKARHIPFAGSISRIGTASFILKRPVFVYRLLSGHLKCTAFLHDSDEEENVRRSKLKEQNLPNDHIEELIKMSRKASINLFYANFTFYPLLQVVGEYTSLGENLDIMADVVRFEYFTVTNLNTHIVVEKIKSIPEGKEFRLPRQIQPPHWTIAPNEEKPPKQPAIQVFKRSTKKGTKAESPPILKKYVLDGTESDNEFIVMVKRGCTPGLMAQRYHTGSSFAEYIEENTKIDMTKPEKLHQFRSIMIADNEVDIILGDIQSICMDRLHHFKNMKDQFNLSLFCQELRGNIAEMEDGKVHNRCRNSRALLKYSKIHTQWPNVEDKYCKQIDKMLISCNLQSQFKAPIIEGKLHAVFRSVSLILFKTVDYFKIMQLLLVYMIVNFYHPYIEERTVKLLANSSDSQGEWEYHILQHIYLLCDSNENNTPTYDLNMGLIYTLVGHFLRRNVLCICPADNLTSSSSSTYRINRYGLIENSRTPVYVFAGMSFHLLLQVGEGLELEFCSVTDKTMVVRRKHVYPEDGYHKNAAIKAHNWVYGIYVDTELKSEANSARKKALKQKIKMLQPQLQKRVYLLGTVLGDKACFGGANVQEIIGGNHNFEIDMLMKRRPKLQVSDKSRGNVNSIFIQWLTAEAKLDLEGTRCFENVASPYAIDIRNPDIVNKLDELKWDYYIPVVTNSSTPLFQLDVQSVPSSDICYTPTFSSTGGFDKMYLVLHMKSIVQNNGIFPEYAVATGSKLNSLISKEFATMYNEYFKSSVYPSDKNSILKDRSLGAKLYKTNEMTIIPGSLAHLGAGYQISNFGLNPILLIMVCPQNYKTLEKMIQEDTEHSIDTSLACQMRYDQKMFIDPNCDKMELVIEKLAPMETIITKSFTFLQIMTFGSALFLARPIILVDYKNVLQRLSGVPECYCHQIVNYAAQLVELVHRCGGLILTANECEPLTTGQPPDDNDDEDSDAIQHNTNVVREAEGPRWGSSRNNEDTESDPRISDDNMDTGIPLWSENESMNADATTSKADNLSGSKEASDSLGTLPIIEPTPTYDPRGRVKRKRRESKKTKQVSQEDDDNEDDNGDDNGRRYPRRKTRRQDPMLDDESEDDDNRRPIRHSQRTSKRQSSDEDDDDSSDDSDSKQGKSVHGLCRKKRRVPFRAPLPSDVDDPSVITIHQSTHVRSRRGRRVDLQRITNPRPRTTEPSETKRKTFVCKQVHKGHKIACGKRFTTKTHLDRHQWEKLDIRPYSCGTCLNNYAKLLNRTIDELEYTRDHRIVGVPNSYVVRYKRASDLNTHFRSYVHTTEEMLIRCPHCGARFTVDTHLQRHIRGGAGRQSACPALKEANSGSDAEDESLADQAGHGEVEREVEEAISGNEVDMGITGGDVDDHSNND